jgi:hypothetical protein
MTNFATRSQNLEAACKSYAHRSEYQKSTRQLRAALDDIERFPVGSPEWKEAVKRNAAILSK